MVGYVCTIASGKGGVGKTTTAVNVSTTLASAGHDVVVVDADLGMANLAGMLDLDVEHSVHDVLAGEATVSAALTRAGDGLQVVPGETSLDAFAAADPAKLRTVIDTLRHTHDLVVVDTGAGLSHETTVPLGVADGVVLVTTPREVAVEDAAKTAQLADRIDGDVVGLLATRVRGDMDVRAIRSCFECPVLGVIPDDDAAGEEPIVVTSPDSAAADAYERLRQILEDVFFDGRDPDDLRTVGPPWLGATDPEDGTDLADEEDGGGSLLGFFRS